MSEKVKVNMQIATKIKVLNGINKKYSTSEH